MIYETADGHLMQVDGMADIPDGWTLLPERVGRERWDAHQAQVLAEFENAVAQMDDTPRRVRRAELIARLAGLIDAEPGEVADLLGVHLPDLTTA